MSGIASVASCDWWVVVVAKALSIEVVIACLSTTLGLLVTENWLPTPVSLACTHVKLHGVAALNVPVLAPNGDVLCQHDSIMSQYLPHIACAMILSLGCMLAGHCVSMFM